MRSLRQLSDKERSTLENELKNAKDAANWKRVFVILNYDDGLSIEELAKSTRLSRWTVEEYLKEYSSKSKTDNDPRGGSSSKLTEIETRKLEQHLSETTYLKVKDIITYVKVNFGKSYSRTGMTHWLQKHGFTFKRPEKVPGKVDPIRQQKFIEEYEKLKNELCPDDEIYFLDAVHPEYQSQAVCGWIKKGERKTLQTTGKQTRLHLVGALSLKEMGVTLREYQTIDADSIISFLKDLESTTNHPGTIHVILDNAAAHRSKKVIQCVSNSRIQLHYLPPYSPNLNPIERLWKIFRERTLYNHYYEKFEDFAASVRSFFADKVHRIQGVLRRRINDNFQIIKLNPIKLN